MTKDESYENFLQNIQPNKEIRKLVQESLNAFCKREKLDLSSLSKAAQRVAISGFLRIGIPVSKDTVYPVVRGTGANKTVTIQDNYLFLQRLILEHTKATHLVVDIIYKDEYDCIKGVPITRHFNKNEHVPLGKQSADQSLDNVHSIIIGVSGDKITENTFKIYSREFLLARVGSSLFSNREWGMTSAASDASSVKRHLENKHRDHKRLEMLKKTAIRAFAKERYGSSLELIRTIDIVQNEILTKENI